MESTLVIIPDKQELQVARSTPLDVGALLRGVVQTGVTKDNVEAIDRLVGLYERMDARHAEREFAEAFLNLQSELPVIKGTRPIPDKQGNVKFCYANFEDIDLVVRPICLRNGFTYSFAEGGIKEGRIMVIMTLTHKGGHSRPIPYSVRVGSGPPGAGESQADVSGHTYAQRGAIEAGLSLRVIGRPEDARMEGAPIGQAYADELEHRLKMVNGNVTVFLQMAGVDKFKDIPTVKAEVLEEFLRMKENPRK